jgi:hypothetical protein
VAETLAAATKIINLEDIHCVRVVGSNPATRTRIHVTYLSSRSFFFLLISITGQVGITS